jgi:DNA-binding transcriptional LysR family regulator
MSAVELADLETFATVAEELHFARAAQRLEISPAAVSQRIRGLEDELGVVLFERTSRQVRLSAAGTQLLEPARACRAAAGELRRLAASLASGASGRVSLALAPHAGPFGAELITRLLTAHPELEVTGLSMWAGEALVALRAGEVAGAVIRAGGLTPEFAAITLGSYRDDHVALPETDPLAGRDTVSAADLHGRSMLIVDHGLGPRVHEGTRAWAAAAGVVPRWREHGFGDYRQVMALVAGGQGATLVDAHHARESFPGVRIVALAEPGPAYEMALVVPAHTDSPAVRAVRAAAQAVRSSSP